MRVDGGKDVVSNVIKAVDVARRYGFLVVWVNFCAFLVFVWLNASIEFVFG